MIDLMAIAAVDRETEVTYIRRERGWAAAAEAEGRRLDPARMLPVLPATVPGIPAQRRGTATGTRHGDGHGHGTPSSPAGTSRPDVLKHLVPIILALAVMGAVTGIAAVMLIFLGQDWDDALFWVFAAARDRRGCSS